MPEETEFTFTHFVDPELLAARVEDLGGRYTEEDVAATAFYLGILSVTGMAQVVPLYGDSHFLMHVMSNIYAGEWLSEVIKAGAIDPENMRDLVLKEHGWALQMPSTAPDGTEDIKAEPEAFNPNLKPMDESTFNRLWGGHGA